MTDKTEKFRECIGCGCCGAGDIRFNVVGEGEWALKAQEKARKEA